LQSEARQASQLQSEARQASQLESEILMKHGPEIAISGFFLLHVRESIPHFNSCARDILGRTAKSPSPLILSNFCSRCSHHGKLGRSGCRRTRHISRSPWSENENSVLSQVGGGTFAWHRN